MSLPLLHIIQLQCERDDRVLFSDLNFQVVEGDVIQLEGPNGSGKTTLLRMLAGLIENYEGEIQFQGSNILEDRAAYSLELLVLGHKSGVNGALTAMENLKFLVGLHHSFDEEDAYEALAKVGLAGFEHAFCRNLSAGQQRRVSLARLYLSQAKIWLLDEIFTAIDKAGVAQFESLLAEKAAQGTAIILTTHHNLSMPQVRQIRLGGRWHV